jgi:sec-independent protein translocase protein TatB
MPSLGDSAFIFILALLLFGPKKLPELARQLGKLMAEFRRASNEFRMQMEEELRISDQAEQQKKIAAMEAAAPVSALPADTFAQSQADAPDFVPTPEPAENTIATAVTEPAIPIATEGDLHLMPPPTGLPIRRTTQDAPSTVEPAPSMIQHAESQQAVLSPVLDAIPHASSHEPTSETDSAEAPQHG